MTANRKVKSLKSFRQIDARGIWAGDAKALDVFALAFAFDCGGDTETWHSVYGWTPAALEQALDRTFPGRHDCGMSGIQS